MRPGSTFYRSYLSTTSFRRDGTKVVGVEMSPFSVWIDDIETPYDVDGTDRIAFALYRSSTGVRLAHLHRNEDEAGHPAELVATHEMPADVRRVAVTKGLVFVASHGELRALRGSEPLVMDPVDIASTAERLVVLDPKGVSWFDASGALLLRRTLVAPSTLAIEPRRTLIVDAGDLFQLTSPDGELELLVPQIGEVERVRTNGSLIYVLVDGALREIDNGVIKTIATYPPGWANFDVGWDLLVDEGHGPVAFYEKTECGCRTRTLERQPGGTSPQPDATVVVEEWVTCPVCRHSWSEFYPG